MQDSSQRKYLMFEINQTLLALDLSAIAEVTDLLPVWPVPFAPSICTGAIHIHGSIFAVVDLAAILGQDSCQTPEKIIILNRSLAGLAFMVSKVFKIVNENDLEGVEAPDRNFSTATLVTETRRFALLDVYNIVQLSEDTMKTKHFFS